MGLPRITSPKRPGVESNVFRGSGRSLMRVVDFGRFSFLAVVATTVLAACGGTGSPPGLPNSLYLQQHSGSSPIKHVVMIVQENRSFNNLFAGFPGTNSTMRGKASAIAPGRTS